jgi:hypothetical protein
MSELREKIAHVILSKMLAMSPDGLSQHEKNTAFEVADQILALIQPEPQSTKSSCCGCGHLENEHSSASLIKTKTIRPCWHEMGDCDCNNYKPCSIQPQELISDEERNAIYQKWFEWDKMHPSKERTFDALMETIAQAQLHHYKTVLFPKWFEEEAKRIGLVELDEDQAMPEIKADPKGASVQFCTGGQMFDAMVDSGWRKVKEIK